ncbi:MAG TPA: hypothetical protein VIV66_16190 [Pyrinomonadaceae bacterium]
MPTRVLKYFILSALTLSPVGSLQARSFAQEPKDKLIHTEYNAENDVSQLTLNPIIIASRKFEELRLGAVAAYKGKVKTRPEAVALVFLSLSKSDVDKYEAARKLTIVADGQRFPFGEAQRSKQATNGLFIETLTISIPIDVFLRVFRSKEVSLKLGFTEVELLPAQIVIFQAFGSYATE